MDKINWIDKFNVPGSVFYNPDLALDIVILSRDDERLRGYWLERDRDGQIVVVSNQSNADNLVLDKDPDGTDVIVFDDALTEEFSFDGNNVIGMKRYS